MILIYNLSGLLLGLVGGVAGLLTALLTGRLSFGLIILASVWLAFGWRKIDGVTGLKKPFPSIFFIPLVFLAMPILLLSLPMFFVESSVRNQPIDARTALLQSDEQSLRTYPAGGNVELSKAVLKGLESMLIEEAKAEDFHVFTREKPGAVLVHIQAPNLKKFEDEARSQLLNVIEGILMAGDAAARDYYIGIKGRVSFGAIRVSPNTTKLGAVVQESLLYPFYDDPTST